MPYAWLLILLPFAGSAWLAFRGRRMSEAQVGRVAAGAVGLSFVLAVVMALQLLLHHQNLLPRPHFSGLVPSLQLLPAAFTVAGPTWIGVGNLDIGFRLLVDPLSSVMTLVVSGVGFLIHLYARGYMHGDANYPRFFALLNLFVGAMMTLVLADSLPLMFIGWEGVGFCSYMLIGYYTERHSASQAGKKAFIVNRIGDLGFLIGTFLLWKALGTMNFREIAFEAPRRFIEGDPLLTWAALCFFVGATGKSAQFPLYIWLPDAMEGPTPVSALIHAATMVTSGVYLVVRLGVVYALAPVALQVVAVIGLLTALMAGLLALVQNDIKRVLAYSTISQLGYMFLAAGVGAYTAAIFHLVTHAFFKALLFLGSGSVIHAVEHALHEAGEHQDPQDMRNMGGLREKLPTTFWTMLLGSAAIAGVPLLSGFFSKDEILFYAGQQSGLLLGVGLFVALLTAFYMFRLMLKTFWQDTRMSPAAWSHLHESPPVMTQPLVALAVLSVVGGLLNLPGHGLLSQKLGGYLATVTGPALAILHEHAHEHSFADELRGMVVSSIVALLGIGLAWALYYRNTGLGWKAAQRFPRAYRSLTNLYYLEWAYRKVVVEPGYRLSLWLAQAFDQGGIDYLVNQIAAFFGLTAERARSYQPGYVRSYALWFAAGAVALLGSLALHDTGWVAWVVAGLAAVLIAAVGIVSRPKDEA
ncbi:MAG: NADH-quinone oxidoreductase subunit L [Armatimonadetes bacterium]|nr:NADH-quinone oxidoreductase subunit L [Armatimonadota bacterium]